MLGTFFKNFFGVEEPPVPASVATIAPPEEKKAEAPAGAVDDGVEAYLKEHEIDSSPDQVAAVRYALDQKANKEISKDELIVLLNNLRRIEKPVVVENLAPTDPLHEAAKKVQPIVPCNSWNVGCEIRKLGAYRDGLSKLERAAFDKVSDRIFEEECKIRDAVFQRIDMKWIMKQRTKEGWPAFAIFDSQRPECQIKIEENNNHFRVTFASAKERIFPSLFLRDEYRDITGRLHKEIDKRYGRFRTSDYSCSISCKFTGVLPNKVRDLIKQYHKPEKVAADLAPARGVLGFQNVYIVMEAPAWQVDMEVLPQNLDPLVIGEFGDAFWLLDVFDVTPLERIAASEFAEWKK